MITGLFLRIVQQDIETSRQCDDELLCEFVGMPSPFFSTWNIIQVIDSLYIKRQRHTILNYRKITPTIFMMFVKLDHCTVENAIFFHLFSV